MEKEIFKEFKLNPMYEISNYGNVRSLYKANGRSSGKYRDLDGLVNNCGYRLYSLKVDGSDKYGYRRCFMAHRLVYEHFIGVIPDGMEIDHLDNDKLNNYVGNLEAVSHRDNVMRSYARGRKRLSGEEHWLYGSKHSVSAKRKMSDAKKGVNHPKFSGYYVVNGVKYASPSEASAATGILGRTISRRCKSGTVNGYSFEPVSR